MRIMVRKAGTASLTLPHLILTTLIIISEPTRIRAAGHAFRLSRCCCACCRAIKARHRPAMHGHLLWGVCAGERLLSVNGRAMLKIQSAVRKHQAARSGKAGRGMPGPVA